MPDHAHDHNGHSTQPHNHQNMPKEQEELEEASHAGHHEHMVEDFRRRFWISLFLTVPIVLLAPMIQGWLGLTETLSFPYDDYVAFGLATVLYFYGGWPFLTGLIEELRNRRPGMMTLIGMAITVAYGYSVAVTFGLPGETFYWELATLITVMLLGHWIEMKSVMGASRALDELARLMPKEAHRVEAGSVRDVPVADLKRGDKIIVKPGEKVPADGIVVEGETSINEAMVTGESRPVAKALGDEVIGGSINEEGSITVEVRKVGKESFLAQVMNLVESAQRSKSRTQRLADRAALWLTIIALSVAAITWVIWYYVLDRELVFVLGRTVTVLVIACPHALGLAIPLVVAVSTAQSARNGLLIRNRAQFEGARKINAVMFDKTGTLTQGSFAVDDVLTVDTEFPRERLLSLAGSVEARSEHLIGRAIAEAARDRREVRNFRAIPGKGVEGDVDEHHILVVSSAYLDEKKITLPDEKTREFARQGRTVAWVLIDGNLKGGVALRDPLRQDAVRAIEELKGMGIRVLMITGDNRHVAGEVARELNIDDFFAEVLPEHKSDKVKEVQKSGLRVAMVGDGVNDAPALAQADVGIAIGAGTDVAAEAADVVLVKSSPMDVVKVIKYADATYRKMVQNLIYATAYNVVALPLAAGVLYTYGIVLNPAMGALLMSLSTVAVAINARLLKLPSSNGNYDQ